MVKTKESEMYVRFFQENKYFLLSPLFIGMLTGGWYANQLPSIYRQSVLLEMQYSSEDIPQKTALTDEAVTLLRSAHIHQHIKVDSTSHVLVYKPGPVSIVIDVEDRELARALNNSEKLMKFTESRFPVSQQGSRVETVIKKSFILYTIVAAGIGLIFGILISFLKTYLRNY